MSNAKKVKQAKVNNGLASNKYRLELEAGLAPVLCALLLADPSLPFRLRRHDDKRLTVTVAVDQAKQLDQMVATLNGLLS